MEYVNGMTANVKNAGMESPMYRQLISVHALAIIAPTSMSVQPVAQGGIEAKIGAKKMEMKKHNPVTHAVIPVAPPSEIPAPDSMNAVTGGEPKSEPMVMENASTTYATALPSKSPVSSSMAPQNRAMEYSVPVASRMST